MGMEMTIEFETAPPIYFVLTPKRLPKRGARKGDITAA